MPRGTLRCFISLCTIVILGLFVSILDRVITLSYASYNSSFDIQLQSKRSRINDVEYSGGRTYRTLIQPLLGEISTHKSNKSVLKSQQTKQLTGRSNSPLNFPQKVEFETRLQGSQVYVQDNKKFESVLDQERTSLSFKTDWCRMQRARLDWKAIITPCINQTAWEEPLSPGINQLTDPSKCFITYWEIKQAGEFSRFFIQTVTTSNVNKTVGGDSWRIHLHGPSSLAPTVLDHNDGIYEVLFLIMEDGDYDAEIFLDYSLCHGFKDPPPSWFKSGNSQGKNQPDGSLKGDRPYLISPFRDGQRVHFFVPPSNNGHQQVNVLAAKMLSDGLKSYTCDSSCNTLLWDGFGRWVNDQWQPYIKEEVKRDKRRGEGTFFSFGDSVSNMFLHSLSLGPYRDLCKTVFSSCQPVYHWVYDMRGYWGDGIKSPREPVPDNVDYNHELVMSDIRKTLYSPRMNNKSVLLLNLGIHFAAAVNFTNYKRLIDDLIITVNNKNTTALTTETFKGTLIWKTTTALNRERFPNPHKDVRRFLTFPRVELYNAYATSAMCRAGIDVIDVYPVSNSYPGGTVSKTDPVHFADRVFGNVESLLHKMFSP